MKRIALLAVIVTVILVALIFFKEPVKSGLTYFEPKNEVQTENKANNFFGSSNQIQSKPEAGAPSANVGSTGGNASPGVQPPSSSEMFDNNTTPTEIIQPPRHDSGNLPLG